MWPIQIVVKKQPSKTELSTPNNVIREHGEEEMKVKMKITKKFRDPLTRQANEAVRISHRSKNQGELLNSKSEFNHPPVARIVIEKRNFVKNVASKNSKIGCNITASKP